MLFDDMTADMEDDKKLSPLVAELFMRGRKRNISLVFILQSYFKVPKGRRLNVTHYFIMKIPNKINRFYELIFMKLHKDYTKEPVPLLVNDNPLRFRKNILQNDNKITNFDNKIEQNKAQYNLDRQTARISALSSGNIGKYEFLMGEDVLSEKKLLQLKDFNIHH